MKLHEYQEYAKNWIIEKPYCALFLDLGLGKTIITLTALNELIYDRFEVSKVLIIAPLRVAKFTWDAECKKWGLSLKMIKVLGNEKQRLAALDVDADIYIINRENVEWLCKYWDMRMFDCIVIDELSSFKSAKSSRWKSLKKVRPKRLIGLTGTPAPNGLLDLWPQIFLLDQGQRLGKYITHYRERYFVPDKRNREVIYSWKLKPESERAIYEKISDICVSMKSVDYLDIPERVDNVIRINLEPRVLEQYEQLEKDLLLPLKDADVTAANMAVLTNKLLQMANGTIYDEFKQAQVIHNCKLEVLEDLIEAANGNPMLVFYMYRHDLERIKERFECRELKTDADIEDWNNKKIPLLLAHPASAGHGLNLQHGSNIITWYGLPWSLELYQQANARLHRQGQQQKVVVNHIIATDTMDEDVLEVLQNKADRQDALLAAVKARIRRMEK